MNVLKIVDELSYQYSDTLLSKVDYNFANEVYIGRSYIYKVTTDEHRLEKKDHLKEEFILKLLHEKLKSKKEINLIPKFIKGQQINDSCYIQIHSKLDGSNPDQMSSKLIKQIVDFASAIHSINHFTEITEFEEGKTSMNFNDYIRSSVNKFYKKLAPIVNSSDIELIELGRHFILDKIENVENIELVLVHKDIYNQNLLFNNGKLTGVVDWEACQVAPKEWEIAILIQRYPEYEKQILSTYKHKIDLNVLKICGITQALRFWKSFPNDKDFVETQRNYIKILLKSSNDNHT